MVLGVAQYMTFSCLFGDDITYDCGGYKEHGWIDVHILIFCSALTFAFPIGVKISIDKFNKEKHRFDFESAAVFLLGLVVETFFVIVQIYLHPMVDCNGNTIFSIKELSGVLWYYLLFTSILTILATYRFRSGKLRLIQTLVVIGITRLMITPLMIVFSVDEPCIVWRWKSQIFGQVLHVWFFWSSILETAATFIALIILVVLLILYLIRNSFLPVVKMWGIGFLVVNLINLTFLLIMLSQLFNGVFLSYYILSESKTSFFEAIGFSPSNSVAFIITLMQGTIDAAYIQWTLLQITCRPNDDMENE